MSKDSTTAAGIPDCSHSRCLTSLPRPGCRLQAWVQDRSPQARR